MQYLQAAQTGGKKHMTLKRSLFFCKGLVSEQLKQTFMEDNPALKSNNSHTLQRFQFDGDNKWLINTDDSVVYKLPQTENH